MQELVEGRSEERFCISIGRKGSERNSEGHARISGGEKRGAILYKSGSLSLSLDHN